MLQFLKNLFSPEQKSPIKEVVFSEYKPKAPVKDKRLAKCPYCGIELEKIPSSKKKCLNCGNYIFVRTLPNRDRVICTELEKDRIDFIKELESYSLWSDKNESRYSKKNADMLQSLSESYLSNQDYNRRKFRREFYTKLIEINSNLPENNKFTLYSAYSALSDLDRLEGKDPSNNRKLAQKYTISTNIKFN